MNGAQYWSSTTDITPAVRAKRWCGVAAWAGYLIASFGIVFALAVPLVWILVVSLFAVSLALAAASRIGAVLHLILASSCLGYFIYDLSRFQENLANQPGFASAHEPTISWFWIGVFVLSLGLAVSGVVASIIYHRIAPTRHKDSALLGVLGRWLLRQLLSLRQAGFRQALASYAFVALLVVIYLLPVLFGTGVIGDWGPELWDGVIGSSWLGWVLIGTYVVLVGPAATAGWFLLTRAKRLRAASTAQLRAVDPRPPIVLLRSFQDDLTPIQRRLPFTPWQSSDFYSRAWTLEESMERVMSTYGPVVAIGRPGEALPPAGAAREYLADDMWKARVTELIRQAQIIVVVVGETEGLIYEYKAIQRLAALDRLILVFPPGGADETRERWDRFCSTVDVGWLNLLPEKPETVLMVKFSSGNSPAFVTCKWRDEEDCYRLGIQRQLNSP